MAYKAITAQYDGKCKVCKGTIAAGDSILWESLHKATVHPACKPAAPVVAGSKHPYAKVKPVFTPKAGVKATYPAPTAASYQPAYNASGDPKPATQKGKGIQVLQAAGILPMHMGIVCTTLEAATAAFHKIPGVKFARPCPITARHGFVDSRVVKDTAELAQVWAETKAADPLGEVIVMPLIQAKHNCVWRPGLLAIGPGHDGATAGHDSITVFMQEGYAVSWHALSAQAGVNEATAAPFIESVSHDGIDMVVTQIRSGVRGAPTEPDWIPVPMTVGEVITKDGSNKDGDQMLAWEHEATQLKPGFHIVHDVGGNLGDHWAVHAQLNGIAVVTSFKPTVGQALGKMGIDLAPLEPQMILYGFLGGLLSPSLKDGSDAGRRKRTRATVAAILGTHHGLRMGGEGGVHLGASVAMFLRLAQAALWGEARHAHSHCKGMTPDMLPGIKGIKGLSRQQIFTKVLDNWIEGRAGLRDVVRAFHMNWQGGGYGGPAWAAIGHATVALDSAMLDLAQLPSRLNAKRVMAALTTAVNMAHNAASSFFLDKFCGMEWFNLAADLDPRAALMAGPIWYEATLADTDDRLALLAAIEGMSKIDIGHKAPKGNIATPKGHHGHQMLKSILTGSVDATQPVPVQTYPAVEGGKVGNFGTVSLGATMAQAGVTGTVVKAQAKLMGLALHVQLALDSGGYMAGDVHVPADKLARVTLALSKAETFTSMAGTSTKYKKLNVTVDGVFTGMVTVLATE